MLNLFIQMVRRGDQNTALGFLNQNPQMAKETLGDGGTLLHLAARHNAIELGQRLLELAVSINAKNHESRTALHDAFENGSEAFQQWLLEQGAEADVNYAAAVGDLARLKEILGTQPNLARDTSTGISAMEWAAFGNRGDSIRVLLEHGANHDDANPKDGGTPLMAAAQCNHIRAAKQLLYSGADPDQTDHLGFTALHFAATLRYTPDSSEVTELLLSSGAFVNARGKGGFTPLGILHNEREKSRGEKGKTSRDFEAVEQVLLHHGAII